MNSVEENKLSNGWYYDTIGNVIFENKKSKIKVKEASNLEDYPFFTSGKKVLTHNDYLVDSENIFMATGGVAQVKYFKGKSSYSTDTYCFTSKTNNLRFIFYFVKSIITLINQDYFKGVGLKHLQKKDFRNISIPIPPIKEQERIVAKIDDLFAKIDKAISLTEDSLKQSENLLPSVLKEVFENCGGDNMKLSEVSVIQPKKNEVKDLDCEVSFVPMKFLNKKKIDFVPESDRNISEVYKGYTYFQDGDILLAKVIPCFQNGKSGVAKGLTNGIGFGSSEFIVFRPYDFILQEWLYYNISSSDFLFEGNNNMSGAVGLKRLTKSFVSEWKIKVPDLKTQKKFIDRINKVSNQSTKTQSKLERKLAYLKQLKSSILSKAFKGEL